MFTENGSRMQFQRINIKYQNNKSSAILVFNDSGSLEAIGIIIYIFIELFDKHTMFVIMIQKGFKFNKNLWEIRNKIDN